MRKAATTFNGFIAYKTVCNFPTVIKTVEVMAPTMKSMGT